MSKIHIFVSYAHADLENYPGYTTSRVKGILDEIKHRLRCHDQRGPFTVLRDREGLIRVSENIDDKIRQGIESCDIGLVFLSRSYRASEECRAEICMLLDRNKRIFIVETEDVWDDDFENQMRAIRPRIERTLRVQFYSGSLNDRKLFGDPLPQFLQSSDRKNYDEAITQVVRGIEAYGGEVQRARKAALGLPAEDLGRHTVFLAYPTADVRREASNLAATLQKAGHSTLCFSPSLHIGPEDQAQDVIKSAIADCDVVVQLLGGVPGSKINGRYLTILQNEIAKATGKPLHVWRSPNFDPNECGSEYAEFLNSTVCHQTNYEEFEQYALKQIDAVVKSAEAEQRRKQTVNKAAAEGDILPSIAIDVAEPDFQIANVVMQALQTRAGVSWLPYEIDRAKLEEAVHDNDGIVMVFAESRAGQTRINAHFPIIHKIRQRNRLFDIAIGNGAPTEGPVTSAYPRGPNVYVIKVDSKHLTVEPSSLNQFLDGVRANAVQRAAL